MTTVRSALNDTLRDLMRNDALVILLGEDIAGGQDPAGDGALGGCFGVTAGLYREFGSSRVMDMPISETAFVGMAVGAAMTGLKPIVEIMFCDFMGVCFDQIINQAAKKHYLSGGQRDLPLVIRTTYGAGESSAAMHSQSLYGLLMQIAGLSVAVPSTPIEAEMVLRQAVDHTEPTVIFEHKNLYDQGDIDWTPKKEQKPDYTVVALGAMAHKVKAVQEKLAEEGMRIDLIKPVWISPLDCAPILESLGQTGRLFVVDEGTHQAGFADAVIAEVSRRGFDLLTEAPISITPPAYPIPYASDQEADWLPSEEDIFSAIKEELKHAG
ncbi:transketolase C-terminal domain-containing protein [Temperatibacter marinus]|uniref:Transketolase C-terminal domain-containing protein n=1 Tax=Temperatibacter marinus TaxID=1456591 RepID=A0AA52EFJ2_9PROT|nr:transketolase C-terminal domain-containing protein [Temperatibacter marinus]WND03780.1 transketolase C-terminal domain-containing protein [Temperatibacter marinus]